MSRKTQHTRFEDKILRKFAYEDKLKVVEAWTETIMTMTKTKTNTMTTTMAMGTFSLFSSQSNGGSGRGRRHLKRGVCEKCDEQQVYPWHACRKVPGLEQLWRQHPFFSFFAIWPSILVKKCLQRYCWGQVKYVQQELQTLPHRRFSLLLSKSNKKLSKKLSLYM